MKEEIKGMSKAIAIIAKVIKICLIIGLIGILLGATILPPIFKNISIVDDINAESSSFITISQTDDKMSIKVSDKIVLADVSIEEYDALSRLLNNDTKTSYLYYLEGILFVGFIMLVVLYIIMNYVEKLFENIYIKDTPFILDNVSYIRKIAYLSIIYIVAPLILGGIFEMITGIDLKIDFNLLSIIIVLVLFVFSYIFEYGYSLENKKVKSK